MQIFILNWSSRELRLHSFLGSLQPSFIQTFAFPNTICSQSPFSLQVPNIGTGHFVISSHITITQLLLCCLLTAGSPRRGGRSEVSAPHRDLRHAGHRQDGQGEGGGAGRRQGQVRPRRAEKYLNLLKNICVQDAAGGDAEAEGAAGGGEQPAGRQLPHQGRHGSGQRPRILFRIRLQGSQGQRLRQREELLG